MASKFLFYNKYSKVNLTNVHKMGKYILYNVLMTYRTKHMSSVIALQLKFVSVLVYMLAMPHQNLFLQSTASTV